jgi:hypothetical protein
MGFSGHVEDDPTFRDSMGRGIEGGEPLLLSLVTSLDTKYRGSMSRAVVA